MLPFLNFRIFRFNPEYDILVEEINAFLSTFTDCGFEHYNELSVIGFFEKIEDAPA